MQEEEKLKTTKPINHCIEEETRNQNLLKLKCQTPKKKTLHDWLNRKKQLHLILEVCPNLFKINFNASLLSSGYSFCAFLES